jgi:hypothetical protein
MCVITCEENKVLVFVNEYLEKIYGHFVNLEYCINRNLKLYKSLNCSRNG